MSELKEGYNIIGLSQVKDHIQITPIIYSSASFACEIILLFQYLFGSSIVLLDNLNHISWTKCENALFHIYYAAFPHVGRDLIPFLYFSGQYGWQRNPRIL